MCKQEGNDCSGKDCYRGSNVLRIQYGSSWLMALKGVEGIRWNQMAAEVAAVYQAHKNISLYFTFRNSRQVQMYPIILRIYFYRLNYDSSCNHLRSQTAAKTPDK